MDETPSRYVALVPLTFPSADDLSMVIAAGGLSKLTKEELDQVTFEHVEVGEICSNVPFVSIPLLLASNKIEIVE